ncbi:hypothetical protein D9M70_410310 [compost metagenome]
MRRIHPQIARRLWHVSQGQAKTHFTHVAGIGGQVQIELLSARLEQVRELQIRFQGAIAHLQKFVGADVAHWAAGHFAHCSEQAAFGRRVVQLLHEWPVHFQGDALQAQCHLLGKLAFGKALLEAEQFAKALELQLGALHTQAIAHGGNTNPEVLQTDPTIERRSNAAIGDIHHRRQLADGIIHDRSDRPPERQLDDQPDGQNREQSPLENLRHSDVLEV